jgi:hypothetical protein
MTFSGWFFKGAVLQPDNRIKKMPIRIQARFETSNLFNKAMAIPLLMIAIACHVEWAIVFLFYGFCIRDPFIESSV